MWVDRGFRWDDTPKAHPKGCPRCRLSATWSPGRAGRGLFMLPLIGFIVYVIQLYIWVIIASAILSWLIAFNVVNTSNKFVYSVADMLYRVTEPALRPIRRILPDLGGIDISPVILILFLLFIVNVVLLGWLVPAFM
jgi:YggT family protein